MKDQAWMMIAPLLITAYGAGIVGWFLVRRQRAQEKRERAANGCDASEKHQAGPDSAALARRNA
jgi:hypothetical protein